MITITRITSIDDVEMAQNIYQDIVDSIRKEIHRYLEDYYCIQWDGLETNEWMKIETSVKRTIGDLLLDEEN